ncbi:MAG: cardiolipin synthase [Firmicutes bacterium]|nr:cardiolipin synthase [Bacillota bacterium]
MPWLNLFVALLYLVNMGLAVLLVFFERRNPTTTWLWLMVLLFLPIIGFVLYLFIGQDLRKQKIFAKKQVSDHMQSLACPLSQQSTPPTEVLLNRDVIRFHQSGSRSHLTTDNAVTIYDDGKEKFAALKAAIAGARQFVHLEYYIIRNDKLGREILALLTKKAATGIAVRVLYDGMGGIRLPKNFFRELIAAGGQVACFFPPFIPYLNLRVNYRNHRKICVVDGDIAFIGGFNIGDEYLGLSTRFGYWRDTHLSIRGGAVNCLNLRFMADWQFASREEKDLDSGWFPAQQPAGNTSIQIVSSGPDHKWSPVRDGYMKLINNAQRRISIQTPYFIPDDSILAALRVAALSGVDVRIMIPNKPDHPFIYWATLSHIGTLLKAGVRCYTYEKGFIHSKVVAVDSSVASVGTANMDIRSFEMNFEINAFIYDSAVCSELEAQFDRDIADSSELTLERYQKLPLKVKFKESVSRLLSPLL